MIVLWILNVVLAFAFLAAGLLKLVRPRTALAGMNGMAWTEDTSTPVVKAIAALEVLGALGLVLPIATGVAPLLTPLAALGLTVLMVGATVVHLRRHEPPVPAVVLAVLAAVSTVLGSALAR